MNQHLYLCGICCVGKSTVLHELSQEYDIQPEYTDYFELSLQNPEFKSKHQDPEVQIIYTINQVLKSTISIPKIFDRSPISDLLYSLVFEEKAKLEAGKNKLEAMLEWELFRSTCEKYKTLYILIDDDDKGAEDDILQKMKNRNNGLDVLDRDYITAQRTIFSTISQHIPSYEALIKPKHLKIHTDQYYAWLKNGVLNYMKENQFIKAKQQ